MFDISLGEMALVMVVAVLAIGPKELPTVVRKITRWIRQMKAMVRQITDQFSGEGIDEIHALRAELREKATYIRNAEGEVFRTYDLSDIMTKDPPPSPLPEGRGDASNTPSPFRGRVGERVKGDTPHDH